MPIFLILLRKIKKMGIHSLFSFAAAGGKSLLRQPLRSGRRIASASFETVSFTALGMPVARRAPFPTAGQCLRPCRPGAVEASLSKPGGTNFQIF
jgi:hypothetical protein